MTRDEICTHILAAPPTPHRRLIALVGPPGSGKSTTAAIIAEGLRGRGEAVAVVPMDGFHLDNRLLDADGTRAVKGAPQTFDAAGVLRLVRALGQAEPVIYPVFDRSRDIAIAGAGRVETDCQTVLIEGNYLLLDADPWRALAPLWSLSIALKPPRKLLHERLVARWLSYGLSPEDAEARATENDLKNADLVLDHMLPPDLTLTEALA